MPLVAALGSALAGAGRIPGARLSRGKFIAWLTCVAGALAVLGAPVAAQSVNDAVADLRQSNVTFDQDAAGLTQNELACLDSTTD